MDDAKFNSKYNREKSETKITKIIHSAQPTTNTQIFYATRLLTIFIINKNYYAVSLLLLTTVFKKIAIPPTPF